MNMENIKMILKPEIGVVWIPLLMVAIFAVLMVIFHLWGKKSFRDDYNENTDQVKPYNSGNLDEVNYNIKSSNLYWGFKKAMDRYFDVMKNIHDGDLNNYAKWFVIVVAACFLLIGGGLL